MIDGLLLAALVAGVVWAATEGRRRLLIHRLQHAADQHGFVAHRAPRPLPRRFDVPGAAAGSRADLVVIDPDSGAAAFRHRIRGRNGSGTSEHLHLLVPLPCNAPHVLLRRPTVTNRIGERLGLADTEIGDHHLTRRLGLVDVEVGRAGFDRTWQVSTDDERFVRRLASARTASEWIRRSEFEGTPLRYELFGPWMLVSGPDHTIDGAMLLLGWLARFGDLLPPELADGYPPPPEPVDPWG